MRETIPFIPQLLPPDNVETITALKQATKAHQALAELKGTAHIIPNETILIETLILREAKESSAIENIITTQDDLYKAKLFDEYKNFSTKKVENYVQGILFGFNVVRKKAVLTNATIMDIQEILLQNTAGFRAQVGTTLKDNNGNIVYTPPQDRDSILHLMNNLATFINNNDFSNIDPLIKMAIIHYQFESIHPFYDGNGRVGRIINILYLVLQRLLDAPILYLSNYIIEHKVQYYTVLQGVREKNDWESMILYLLTGIEVTAIEAIGVIKEIDVLMKKYKQEIRKKLPKMYSQDMINSLFKHPYTKIDFFADDLNISYQTARKYLNKIATIGLLEKYKMGKSNYYFNSELIEILRWK